MPDFLFVTESKRGGRATRNGAEQQARQLTDPFEITLHAILDGYKGKILVNDVLHLLEIPNGQRPSGSNSTITRVHTRLSTCGHRSQKLYT